MTTCCYFLFCQSVGLLFYSPSISLQLIFGVSCTLTRRQTCPGRRTSSALPLFTPPPSANVDKCCGCGLSLSANWKLCWLLVNLWPGEQKIAEKPEHINTTFFRRHHPRLSRESSPIPAHSQINNQANKPPKPEPRSPVVAILLIALTTQAKMESNNNENRRESVEASKR